MRRESCSWRIIPPSVRLWLLCLSVRGVNVVGQVGSVAEAYQLRSGTDVAVVDLDLPDGDGIELVEKFSSDEPKVATLVLSASLAPDRFAAAVDVGAAGVLHKSASISETVGAVRRLKNGEVLLSPDEVVKMLRMVNRRRREEGEARKAIEKLTRCEKEILQALAEGLDSKQIAQKLHITVETERTHISQRSEQTRPEIPASGSDLCRAPRHRRYPLSSDRRKWFRVWWPPCGTIAQMS